MLDLIHSPLFGEIRKYLSSRCGKDTMFLFVPYIKTDVLAILIDGIPGSKVIVTTWHPHDIQSGSSDLGLWPFCKENGITLYVSENLHLKLYSAGMESAILATGNVSRRGMMERGNYEAGILVENMNSNDRLFLEGIRAEARLVDDVLYEDLKAWHEENKIIQQKEVRLEDVVSAPERDRFLISALPMTRNIDDLMMCYARMSRGEQTSDDPEIVACMLHDLTNYRIELGLDEARFLAELSRKFFDHPFIKRIDEFIAPEAYFGRIKEWIQSNCTNVPVPSRRELTGNVQVLLEWFEVLGNGKYKVDVPGTRSQRIRRL